MAALVRAAGARAEIEAPAQPLRRLAVEVQVEQGARPFARRVLGLRDGEAVEPAADREPPAAPRHVDGVRGADGAGEREQRPDYVERPGGALYTPRMDERAFQKD